MRRRGLTALIDSKDSAWPLVQDWLAAARNPVDVLPAVRKRGEQTLVHLQVTTRSPLGAVALEIGGILVDRGWLRLLGSGSERLTGSLLTWNDGTAIAAPQGALIVAHDAVGGFFALNGDAFVGGRGSCFYWAPDALEWEDLKLSYSQLIGWAAAGEVGKFYETMRWPGWEREAAGISGDWGIGLYPPLWASGEPVAGRSRRRVPMTELWMLGQETARQLENVPEGTRFEVVIDKDG